MIKLFSQALFVTLAATCLVGCANVNMPSLGGVFSGESGSVVRVKDGRKTSSDALSQRSAASVLVAPYMDGRKTGNPRRIGTGAEFVSGLSGKDILLDQDVAVMVTAAMKRRLDDAGFQVSEVNDGIALFELSGVVRELVYDVKARDEVSIVIETTLKEIATGKTLWSGIVSEKNDRFAGVSGNNKADIAAHLSKQLGIVTGKTAEAISVSLLAAHPELSKLPPGVRAVPGVTVLAASSVASAPGKPAPALAAPQSAPTGNASVPEPAYLPHATATSGLLLIKTSPARAKIYLDEVYYGLSPLRLELAPGVLSMRVKLEGYKPVVEKVSVRKGDSTEMDMNLER